MSATAPSKSAQAMAWLVVALIVAMIIFGAIWYGFSAEVQQRIWRDIVSRPGGPMTFRFILQPCMSIIAAVHDGLKDARLERAPYFWTVLSDRRQRMARLREGLISTARVILLGIVMDVIYQYKVLNTLYPGEAALVALLLAFIPYLLLRGPIARLAWWWGHRHASHHG